MSRNNRNPMGWHTNQLMLLHERQFAYGGRYILPMPVGELLPFQFVKEGINRPITRFEIIHEDGSSTDILADVSSQIDYKSGPTGSTYSIVRFKALRALSGNWDEGWKRSIVSDGINTWYSDYFLWTSTPLMKIEWWHPVNVNTEDGAIDYSENFKFWVYLRTDIGMPQYPNEREIDSRETVEFPFRITSYKQYQFPIITSEYLMDCLRLVPLHAEIRIYHLDDVLRVSRIEHGQVEWIERGDVAKALWTFRTNTVVSTYSQFAGEAVDVRACYPVNYTAERLVEDTYGALSLPGGLANTLTDPGYVLYTTDSPSSTRLYFVPVTSGQPYEEYIDQGDVIFDRSTETYYLVSSYLGGSIAPLSITGVATAPAYTIEAIILADTFIRIEYRTLGGQWTTIETIASSLWGSGYDLGANALDYYEVRLVFITDQCGDFFTTQGWVIGFTGDGTDPQGVGFDTIGIDNMVH